jgi:opine dehydrogenase
LEDVPTGILPMIELAEKVGLETPLMRSIYFLTEALLDVDFKKNGRTLKNLGIENYSLERIWEML